MLTIYARLEPTRDAITRKYVRKLTKAHRDAVFYRDASAKEPFARWMWHLSGRPTARRSVTLNCYRWRVEWLPALAELE